MTESNADRPPAEPTDFTELGRWLGERRDHIRVGVAPGDGVVDGDPWNVVIHIDGSYAGRDLAEHMASVYAARLTHLLGGPVGVAH